MSIVSFFSENNHDSEEQLLQAEISLFSLKMYAQPGEQTHEPFLAWCRIYVHHAQQLSFP